MNGALNVKRVYRDEIMERVRLKAEYFDDYNPSECCVIFTFSNNLFFGELPWPRIYHQAPILAKQIKAADGKCVDIEISMEVVE